MARTKDFLKNYQKKRSFNQNALSTSNPVSTTEIDPAAFRVSFFFFLIIFQCVLSSCLIYSYKNTERCIHI